MNRLKRKNHGFSMTEIITVVIIMGMLAAAAVPGYRNYIRRMNLEEGKGILQAIYVAQKDYHLRNGNYSYESTRADINSALDIEIPDISQNGFTNLQTHDSSNIDCGLPSVGSVQYENLRLDITKLGQIVCKDTDANSCAADCAKMGF